MQILITLFLPLHVIARKQAKKVNGLPILCYRAEITSPLMYEAQYKP